MTKPARHALRIILAITIVAGAFCTEGGCQQSQIPDAIITTGTSVAVSTYLQRGVSDPARRTAIARLGSGIAGSVRTITTNPPPTPDQLSAAITANIPQNLKDQYPEVVAFVVPLVVQGYQMAIQQYGGTDQQRVYEILNDIATGVENGTAPFIH